MIETRRLPVIDVVAGFTSCRESRGAVIQNPRLLILLYVTRVALRAQSNINSSGSSTMAGVAGNRGMRSQKRKPVLMVLHRPRRHAPPLHRVAVVALRAELPPVEIRMAIGALLPRFGKYFRHVARITGNVLVHAP
jgi:hypothetical protein